MPQLSTGTIPRRRANFHIEGLHVFVQMASARLGGLSLLNSSPSRSEGGLPTERFTNPGLNRAARSTSSAIFIATVAKMCFYSYFYVFYDTNHYTIDELQAEIGEQLRAARLRSNLSQAEIADRAGISIGAVKNLESGRGATVKTLVRVVRVLGRVQWILSLQPPVTISPMDMLRASKTKRQRAGKPRNSNDSNF
ncbi:MAG: helix-turn-helix transcriptional regulator [Burkholderiaceae bacterium]|nr:helix-turn-helix transcriptional regulator [Burkholderiaceae bacterium]